MKKFLSVIIITILVVCLSSCGSNITFKTVEAHKAPAIDVNIPKEPINDDQFCNSFINREKEDEKVKDVETEVAENNQETVVEVKEELKTEDKVEEKKENIQPEPTQPKEEEPVIEKPQEEPKEQTVTYTEVNETVYAISEVRIRTGPSTDYEKLGYLKKGASIKRVGIGSNNWSKVIYNGEVAYISSCYLTTDEAYKIEPETVLEEMQRRGSMGRLTILGHSVALFQASMFDINQSQSVVDNKDSAAYMTDWNANTFIADHVHQGFSIIKKAVPNQTTATIDYGTYTETFICTANFIGRNTGSDLVDNNGVSVDGQNAGGIIMYTCNSDGTVTITFWQLAK